MSAAKDLTVLQFNCHSLVNKLPHFKIKLYTLKPHIVCLCETWLSPSSQLRFINYSVVYKHRAGAHPGGGLAILIRNDVSHQHLDLRPYNNGFLEWLAVRVSLNSGHSLDILNIYNPIQPISSFEFTHYFSQLGLRKLIVGDFNAHGHLWEPNRPENPSGRNLTDVLVMDPSLALLTPPLLPTYFNIHHNSFSTLDLSLVSSNFLAVSDVWTEEDLGSDHYPVVTRLGVSPSLVPFRVRPKWQFHRGTWQNFRHSLLVSNIRSTGDVVSDSVAFTESIIAASAVAFPQSKEVITPKYNKPWWTPECAAAVTRKHAAKRQLIALPTAANLVEFRRSEALAKWTIREAKHAHWVATCNSITSATPVKRMWKFVSRMQTPFRRTSHPFICPNAVHSLPSDKAEALAAHYSSVLSSPAPRPFPRHILLPLSLSLLDDRPCPLNDPFTAHELETSLSSLRNSAAGPDMVHNHHLSHLTAPYRTWLLSIFSRSLLTGVVPTSWKSAIILPFLKPDKLPTALSSYRPISLLSCVAKLMESLIASRLMYWLETRSSLRPEQGGFRRRLSAIDQVARLESAVRDAYASGSYLLVVFCDLSKAFDQVWHAGLLYKLSQCGVRGHLLSWLRAYLQDRTFRVYFEGEYSSVHSAKSGVPQGGILSPLLFNVMMRDVPTVVGVVSAEYADDICFYTCHADLAVASARLQSMLSAFRTWTVQWGLTLNLEKTKYMCFSRKRSVPPPLLVGNLPIERVLQHRYLGVILDAPGLRWRPQVRSLMLRCSSIVKLLKCISHRRWGADRSLLLRLYKALARSRLDYASSLYSSAAPSVLRQLNVVQNNCLRLALGCRKTTPILSLEAESHVPPLSLRRLYLNVCSCYRLSQLPADLPVFRELVPCFQRQPLHQRLPSSLPSFPEQVRSSCAALGVAIPRPSPSPLVSPLPPWFDCDAHIITEFCPVPKSRLPSASTIRIFDNLMADSFSGFLPIFTDGSQVHHPAPSTSAAFCIPCRNVALSWKLSPGVPILGAELFALHQALLWASDNLFRSSIVLFTDSQSSLYLLRSRRPSHYLPRIFEIQRLLLALCESHVVRLQYVPSHQGIPGNELVDAAAGAAHALRYRTLFPLSFSDIRGTLRSRFLAYWLRSWTAAARATGKGLFLTNIKSSLADWPWATHSSRCVETAVARLRLGHAGVRAHLHRFNLADSPDCDCGAVETIEHFLLLCPRLAPLRRSLHTALAALRVPVTLVNVLGGGPFPSRVQQRIVSALVTYLVGTRRLCSL